MLKKIENDVFNIASRIKQINDSYFIVFNLKKNRFEVYSDDNLKCSYCLTIPYDSLDSRTLELVEKTSIRNYKKIIEEMDKNNENLEKQNLNKLKEENDYKIRELLNNSHEIKRNNFKNDWI